MSALATRRASDADIVRFVEGAAGPLLVGTKLRCPGCERVADILDYVPLEHSDRYADQVIVPLKCRGCRHVFALKP